MNHGSNPCFLDSALPRVLPAAVVLLLAAVSSLRGQAPQLPTASAKALEAHLAVAQQAQANKDYVTAEREYRAALALRPDFAEARMNLGLVYQLQNRQTDAMEMFRGALKLKPDLAGANFFLGVDYCKLGEGSRALPYLKSAVREKPDQPETWFWLATAEEMTGQFSAEVATIQKGLTSASSDVDLLYLLGHAYERLGESEAARIRQAAPGSTYAEELLGESYSSSADWPEAQIHLETALAATPNRRRLHVELGEVFLRSGNLLRAEQEFDAELRLDPHNPAALVRRGEARLIQGKAESAFADWVQAIATDEPRTEAILGIHQTGFGDSAFEQLPDPIREQLPTLRISVERSGEGTAKHLALAFLAAQAGDSSRAAAEAALLAKLSPTLPGDSDRSCVADDVRRLLDEDRVTAVLPCGLRVLTPGLEPEFRIRVAQALFEAGNYEESLRALAGLRGAEAHSPVAAYWRARCYKRLAMAAYLRVYLASPDSYRVHQLLGDMDRARGEDQQAIEEYRAAIAQKPALPNLHYLTGHLLWKNFKVAEARQELEAELALNPRHAGALVDLGATYLYEHQPTQALAYLHRAVALEAPRADLHRDLGTAYAELGDYKRAAQELKIAARSDADGAVHYKLAKVYQALGQKDDAAREFELSSALSREAHRKAEERTERLGRLNRPPTPNR